MARQIANVALARCVAPSRLIRMAIDGGVSRISSQSVSDRRRLKIGRCLAIGKAISCPGRTTATSHDYRINVKAELEIELLHNKIDALREQEILQLLNIIQRLSAHLAPELVAAIEAEAVPHKT